MALKLLATIDGDVNRLDRPLYFINPFTRPWYFVFPTLSRWPIIDGSFENEVNTNPTITSVFESGDIKTRPRYTTMLQTFSESYALMTNSDKSLLEVLQDDVSVSSESFRWTNRQDSLIYVVRFMEKITFKLEPGYTDLWRFTLRFIEA